MFATLFDTAHFYWVKLNKNSMPKLQESLAMHLYSHNSQSENIRSMVFCGQNNTVKHGVYCVLQGAA